MLGCNMVQTRNRATVPTEHQFGKTVERKTIIRALPWKPFRLNPVFGQKRLYCRNVRPLHVRTFGQIAVFEVNNPVSLQKTRFFIQNRSRNRHLFHFFAHHRREFVVISPGSPLDRHIEPFRHRWRRFVVGICPRFASILLSPRSVANGHVAVFQLEHLDYNILVFHNYGVVGWPLNSTISRI